MDISGLVLRKGEIRTGLIRRGDYLYNGDKIITNEIGFVSIMMIYERTYIRIYDNSTARILFDKNKKSGKTELVLFEGKLNVEMGKYCNHFLTLNTPSTIAKVSKTDFFVEYKNEVVFNKLRYAIFTALNGNLELENLSSNNLLYLSPGETVVSTLKGDFLPFDTFRSSKGVTNTLMQLY